MPATLTTQQKLDDAQQKYHLLQTGQVARVFVDQNGERVEYSAANKQNLQLYIMELQQIISNGGTVTTFRPMSFMF